MADRWVPYLLPNREKGRKRWDAFLKDRETGEREHLGTFTVQKAAIAHAADTAKARNPSIFHDRRNNG